MTGEDFPPFGIRSSDNFFLLLNFFHKGLQNVVSLPETTSNLKKAYVVMCVLIYEVNADKYLFKERTAKR